MKSVLRLGLAGLIAVCALASAAPAQAAAAKKTVTMTVTVPKSGVEAAHGVLISGKAAYGTTGNAGTVDIYFKATIETSYRKHLSLKAAADGSFRGWDVAGADDGYGTYVPGAYSPGRYKVIYRGNSVRKAATRYVDLRVYAWSLDDGSISAKTLWDSEHSCWPRNGAKTCSYSSATMTVGNGPITFSMEQDCDSSVDLTGKKIVVSFLSSSSNAKPAPRPQEAGRLTQWVERPLVAGNSRGGSLLNATSHTGHFFVRTVEGCYVKLQANQHSFHKVYTGEPLP